MRDHHSVGNSSMRKGRSEDEEAEDEAYGADVTGRQSRRIRKVLGDDDVWHWAEHTAGGHQLVACPLARGCPSGLPPRLNFLASWELVRELVRVSRVST